MEERQQLPKNIRQMGEKEERLRVYLEDYVYTFIQKMEVGEEARAGILLGDRQTAEGQNCFFIHGAVELEGLIGKDGVCFSEETWKMAEEETEQYFPECSICGWFIKGKEEHFPEENMLKQVHKQVFSGENCLMYWKEEDNDCFWMEGEKGVCRLKGYYVYYERNFQMQNYMQNCGEKPASEIVNDRAAQNFRKIMNTKKNKKTLNPVFWTQAGTVAAAAIIFVGSIYLIGRFSAWKSDQDQIPALAVGASVERKTTGEDSGKQEETTEETTEQKSMDSKLNFYGENELPTLRLYSSMSEAEEEESAANDSNLIKNRQTKEQELEEDESKSEDTLPKSQSTTAADDTLEAGVPVRNQKYIIKPGDTLADICIRFYGTTDKIMEICEKNQISNPNTIFIGQEIVLP